MFLLYLKDFVYKFMPVLNHTDIAKSCSSMPQSGMNWIILKCAEGGEKNFSMLFFFSLLTIYMYSIHSSFASPFYFKFFFFSPYFFNLDSTSSFVTLHTQLLFFNSSHTQTKFLKLWVTKRERHTHQDHVRAPTVELQEITKTSHSMLIQAILAFLQLINWTRRLRISNRSFSKISTMLKSSARPRSERSAERRAETIRWLARL